MSKPTEQQMANAIRAARHFTFVANGRVRARARPPFSAMLNCSPMPWLTRFVATAPVEIARAA
jgi:hypothetical protein